MLIIRCKRLANVNRRKRGQRQALSWRSLIGTATVRDELEPISLAAHTVLRYRASSYCKL